MKSSLSLVLLCFSLLYTFYSAQIQTEIIIKVDFPTSKSNKKKSMHFSFQKDGNISEIYAINSQNQKSIWQSFVYDKSNLRNHTFYRKNCDSCHNKIDYETNYTYDERNRLILQEQKTASGQIISMNFRTYNTDFEYISNGELKITSVHDAQNRLIAKNSEHIDDHKPTFSHKIIYERKKITTIYKNFSDSLFFSDSIIQFLNGKNRIKKKLRYSNYYTFRDFEISKYSYNCSGMIRKIISEIKVDDTKRLKKQKFNIKVLAGKKLLNKENTAKINSYFLEHFPK